MSHPAKIALIVAISIVAIVMMFSVSPIAQDLAYHNFADVRDLFGIPNFGDVVGNLPFMVIGVMGLRYLTAEDKTGFTMYGERALWGIFFVGATLVGFGSGYYHLSPNNATLVWDRLPMTIAFMSFFALVIMERIDAKAGLMLCPLLLIIGAASVFYWEYTESIGQGDLRLYALVQFLPMLLIPLMLWLFPARYTGLKYLGHTVAWYLLAKLLEHFDVSIFHLLGGPVSGHTLKHLAAAMAVYSMLSYLKKRQIIS